MKRREVRREVKSKGQKKRHKHLNAQFQRTARREKKRYTHLNAEFQRIARRDKKKPPSVISAKK